MSTEQFIYEQKKFEESCQLLYITQSSYDQEWNSKLHTHSCAEIFYVTRGKGHFYLGTRCYDVFEDDLVIVNPNVTHTEQGMRNTNFEYIVMGIDGLTFTHNNEDPQELQRYNFYENKHEFLYYLKTMLLEVKNKDPEYQIVVNNLLQILIVNLFRRTQVKWHVYQENNVNKDCLFIEKYIESHFKEDITLDTLSKITYLSKYHIVHAFKKYKGISPINYVNEKRIQEACFLLTNINLHINEISQIVGFSSPSYFTQAFKRSLHQSPLQYRKTR